MPLTDLQKSKIAAFIPTFQEYLQTGDRLDDLQIRKDRVALYSELLSQGGIEKMTELEFGKVISSLWSFAMWGNKGFLVSKMLQDNPLPSVKLNLQALLWGPEPIAQRFDAFKHNTRGFGPSTISELLAFTHPNECGLWNTKARDALRKLGFAESFSPIRTNQIDGRGYEIYNQLLHEIQSELTTLGVVDLDLHGIDYFLFEVYQTEDGAQQPALIDNHHIPQVQDFDHDEVIDQLMTIGQWLGFETHKEMLVAEGSRVDVVWQVGIANLGVITYIFEVQRRGSIDSLILNLQRAQNNPTVQRLIVVATQNDINNIQRQVNSLHEGFRRMVGYMDINEVNRANELATELSEIISKLQLVKNEFGV